MRIIRLTFLIALASLAASFSGGQSKTLIERPIADAPSIVKVALVIGIGEYEHANSLKPTTYNDAIAFAAMLRKQFGFTAENITLMTDAPGAPEKLRPTYLHLLNAIDNLINRINEKSEVVVYFSGHGTRAEDQDWLVPLDGLPSNVKASCINYVDFKNRLDTRTPARALLIVDACRNLLGGKDAGSSGFGSSKSLTGTQFAELLSCKPKEVSQLGKPGDFPESVFTHFLLEGLQGAPEAQSGGVVTFDSLKLFVQNKVSGYVSSKFGESQNPDGRASLGGMVLARGKSSAQGGKVKIVETDGQLSVTSEPAGAHIFINNKDTGETTPFTFTFDLKTATQDIKVRLEAEGYKSAQFDVTLEQGKETPIQQKLRQIVIGGGGNGTGSRMGKASGIGSGHFYSGAKPGSPVAGDVWINPKDGAELVYIPGGTFQMGDKDFTDAPPHPVTLTGYWMYRYDITVGQYKRFCNETGHAMPPETVVKAFIKKRPSVNPGWIKEDHPIVNVNWNDAQAYCKWAGVSLPSEAQWERAARGPQGFKFPWGNTFDSAMLWCSKAALGDAGGTIVVGKFPANGYGLFDMASNVWQLCEDCHDKNFYGSRLAEQANPVNRSGNEQTRRVLRGGSWIDIVENYFRCAFRSWCYPTTRDDNIGFRCAVGF